MKDCKQPRPRPDAIPVPGDQPNFRADLRAFLIPEKTWHYVFHLVVALVALAYWAGSLLLLPQASWAEIIMYRPAGDNQLWPVITALGNFNLGDPTDVVNYGRGIGGFQAVILLPHAMAWAVLGPWGYPAVDLLLSWLYFAAVVIFLRRCNYGNFPSLVVGSALATGGLQQLSSKVSEPIAKLLAPFRHYLAEWDFPSLLSLPIFEKRIPRPMVTEILVVLLLYFLFRLWQDRRLPSLKRGLVIGALMALLAQGDPYSFSTLGLLLLGVMARAMANCRWQFPWRFAAGGGLGALLCGWYFVIQQCLQNPESAVRFGLASYSRSKIWLLPGYGPLLRVAVIALLGWVVFRSVRQWQFNRPHPEPESRRKGPGGGSPLAEPGAGEPTPEFLATARSLAGFCVGLVAAAWLAQPFQLFLLGQGAEIYHYFYYTLPTFCAYALLLLFGNLLLLTAPAELARLGRKLADAPRSAGAVGLVLVLVVETVLGIEKPIDAISSQQSSRQEVTPWIEPGNQYRPAFRDLDKQFREHPALRQARSFATFCQEVNFLLTAFHNKRAFLPDNGYTTLADAELERRLCEFGKICNVNPDNFDEFIQSFHVMNFWLGCAKYWCASDHKFAPDSDYAPEQLAEMAQIHKQAPFNLVLPRSEFIRIMTKYEAVFQQPSDPALYPDIIVTTAILKTVGMAPQAELYEEVCHNEVFWVYAKKLPPGK